MGYVLLEHSCAQQYIRTFTVKHIITILHDIKYIVGIAGALVAFLFDKNLGPADDDLPLRFKIFLAAPVIVSIFYSLSLTDADRLGELLYIFSLLIISVLGYASIWSMLGYTKVIEVPRPWWKRWGQPYSYKKVRVMGGRLRDDAKATIEREHINPQIYFEGTAYDQDSVWTRGSRTIAQAMLILTYVLVVLFYTLTISVTLT